MKLPRDLKGEELVRGLCRRWEYRVVHQTGSHIVLETETFFVHRVVVPAHNPVRVGTLNGILRAVAKHKGVNKEDVLQSFK